MEPATSLGTLLTLVVQSAYQTILFLVLMVSKILSTTQLAMVVQSLQILTIHWCSMESSILLTMDTTETEESHRMEILPMEVGCIWG